MNADSSRVELLIPKDERLIAAIEPVVAHAGERAGLSSEEWRQLAREATAACEESFSRAARNGNTNRQLRVLVDDFPTRVEIWIEPYAGSAAAGTQEASIRIVKEHSPSAHSKR
ncbi:MAG TPA: hypothetical protein VJR26_06915 [Candidatus Acidoferrales bacterium]|nr:hypothetical protein [Candidatus Acidoferrales bacterium]